MIGLDPYERYYIYTLLNIHFISLLIALIFSYIVIVKARKGAVKSSFLTVHMLIIIWLIGKILKTVSPFLLMRWSSNVMYYIGIIPLGPAFYLFSRAIIGKVDSGKFKSILFIPSFIFFVILVTNPLHYLFYKHYDFTTDSFGVLFFAHLLLTYIFILLSVLTLLYAVLINKKKKMKALSLAIGALLPLSINLQYIFVSVSPMFDITPIIYNASLIILGFSAFYYDLFEFVPKAVSSALNSLPGTIMLNENLYGNEKDTKGKHLKKNTYAIKIGKLKIKINRYINMKNIVQSTEQLQENVQLVSDRHDQIKHEINIRVSFLQQQERLRLAGEVHDILGYSLSSIICLLETCRFKNLEGRKYRETMFKAMAITDSGIDEMINSFEGKKDTPWKKKFYHLVSEIEIYGINSELILSESDLFSEDYFEVFYLILKEGLTNCIKHGSAKKITIAIQVIGQKVHYYIIDDGVGCSETIAGTGLINMKRRIYDLSGEINIYSEEGAGFQISILLPLHPKTNENPLQRELSLIE